MADREYTPDASPCRWIDEHRCIAHLKASRRRCRQPRVEGARVCRMHGAGAPQVRASAAKRVVEQQARTALHRLGADPIADPLTALSQLAGQVVALKDGLGELVNRLGDQIRYEDAKGAEQLRAEVAVYVQALAECRQVLGLMAKLDIDRRLAAIEEAKAQAVVSAIDAGLAAAGITGAAATEARQAVARRLRSVG